MEGIRVLGTLRVVSGGVERSVGGDRQKRLLALLVLQKPLPVTIDALREHVWGADVGSGTVHTAVSRLRKTLSGVASIEPGGDGYRLVVDDQLLDQTRVEGAIAKGLSLAGSTPHEAMSAFHDALQEWRGRPYSGLEDLSILAPEVYRLEELFHQTTDERFAALLAIGQDAQLIPELSKAVGEQPDRERRAGLLMHVLYRSGRAPEALEVYRRIRLRLDRDEHEPSRDLEELKNRIVAADPRLLVESHESVVLDDAPLVSPYPGLAAFGVADHRLFHGREKLIERLVVDLLRQRWITLSGASGSGKSSLLRAGVVAHLITSEKLDYVEFTPGSDPQGRLRRSITGVHADEGVDLEELVTARLRRSDAPGLVVAADQFEELFTQVHSDSTRESFAQEFAEISRHEQVYIAVAVRADFLGRMAELRDFTPILNRTLEFVGPMSEAEVRRAVEIPAIEAGVSFEPGLVDRFIHDGGAEPGVLPLLQHALQETWIERDQRDRRMTHVGYQTVGGVQGSITQRAHQVLDELDDEERELAREIVLSLIDVTTDRPAARRPRSIAELANGECVIDALARSRLVTVSEDVLELSHESLIDRWPALVRWIREYRADLETEQSWSAAAIRWSSSRRDPSRLYRGMDIAQAQELMDRRRIPPDQLSVSFLESSIDDERQHKRARRRLVGIASFCLISTVVVLSALTGWLGINKLAERSAIAAAQGDFALVQIESTLGKRFLLEPYEVSIGRYRSCYDAGECERPADQAGEAIPVYVDGVIARTEPKIPWLDDDDSIPVRFVHFRKAYQFCEWIGRRLPTKQELIAAGLGEAEIIRSPEAVLPDNRGENFRKEPVAVDAGEVSGWGIHNLAGNVAEWTSTPSKCPDECPYSWSPELDDRITTVAYWIGSYAEDPGWHKVAPNAQSVSPIMGFRCADDT